MGPRRASSRRQASARQSWRGGWSNPAKACWRVRMRSLILSPTPPSLGYSQVPERLGRWRDDFGNLEAAGTETNGVTWGQWVPEAVVRRKEKEQEQKERKARRDAVEKARWKIEEAQREKERAEKAAADAEAAAIRDAKARAKAAEEEKAAAERKAARDEKKKQQQKERMERLMRKGAVAEAPVVV